MFPGSAIPPPRPPTNFIAPALRHQIVAAVVDTPMSCAAPIMGHPGIPGRTTSGAQLSNADIHSASQPPNPRMLQTGREHFFETCGIPSAGRCLVSVRRQDPFVIRSAARARTKPALIPAVHRDRIASWSQLWRKLPQDPPVRLRSSFFTKRGAAQYLAALRRGSGGCVAEQS
jgi:hypothetical protein